MRRDPIVRATQITFAYGRAEPTVLSEFSICVEAGEVVAVVGPSGCGKSTLLFILGLLLRPLSGKVSILGNDVSDSPDWNRSRIRGADIGFVFQDTHLDHGRKVWRNVAAGLDYGSGTASSEARSRAIAELSACDVPELADRRPRHLSGGEAQRVGLARALIKRPSLILADEPTGNLDPDNSNLVLDRLRQAASEGSAAVVVTHDPLVAERCTRVVALGTGK